MDLQGTPISGGGDGQKVTTDPRSNIPKQEGAGFVDPDSLAAESTTFQRENPQSDPPGTHAGPGTQVPSGDSGPGGIGNSSNIIGKTEVQPLRSEGGFDGSGGSSGGGTGGSSGGSGGGSSGGSGGDNAGPGGIGNTTGVIGKTEVAPLTSATGGARFEGNTGGSSGIGGSSGGSSGGNFGGSSGGGSGGDSAGPGGIGNTTGVIGKTELAPLTSATGGLGHISGTGETAPDTGPGGTARGGGEGRGDGEQGQGEAAPSYITNVVGGLDTGGPKGRNLQEGGFEGEASSSLPEPGSKDDPARRAVHDIEERNAISAEATGPRDAALSGGQYSDLDATRQAPHSGN